MKFPKVLLAMLLLPLLIITSCDNDNNDPEPSTPSVVSSVPEDDAVGVNIDTNIEFVFSEEMDESTINTTTVTLTSGATAIVGVVNYSDKKITFNPTGDLAFGTLYTGQVSVAVTSAEGIALDTAYFMSFTTSAEIDEVAPLINITDPLDDATDVARNKTVSIIFNEEMNPATINASTLTVKEGNTTIEGAIGYSGTTATFTPTVNFDANTLYTVTITTTAADLAGNGIAANTSWSFTTGGSSDVLTTIDLGGASNYVILAKTAINNSSTSAITGHLGLSPAATSYITGLALVDFTGYATSAQVTGNVYAADMADPTPATLTTAVNDMITAYNDAAGRPSPDFVELGTGDIGGATLTAGLYKWTSTVTIPSDVTLTGGADDIWIFQIAGDLTQSAAVSVTLNGGAQAKNVFWQVAGEATFGTTSHFEGNILSMTGITFLTGASLNGRALAQTAVILDSNAIIKAQ